MKKKIINSFIYINIVIWLYAFISFIFFIPIETKYFQLKNKKAIDNIYNIIKKDYDNEKDTELNSLHRWNEDINENLQKNITLIKNY